MQFVPAKQVREVLPLATTAEVATSTSGPPVKSEEPGQFYRTLVAGARPAEPPTSSDSTTPTRLSSPGVQPETHFWCINCEESLPIEDRATHYTSVYHLLAKGVGAAAQPQYRLNQKNVGFRLLQKHGWETHQGLGRDNQGSTQPIPSVFKANQRGLGYLIPTSARRITHTETSIAQSRVQATAAVRPPQSRRQILREHERDRRLRRALLGYMHRP